MKKHFILFFLLFLFSASLKSQDMTLPPPNNNTFFNSIAGNWISEPYEMMGSKWIDEAEFKWFLNKQFLELKVVSRNDKGFSYNSYGILSVDREGNYKSWGFDEFGSKNVTHYEGKVEGNKLTSSGGNEFINSTAEIVVEGNITYQVVSFSVKDESGKVTSAKINIIYNKK